MQIQSSKYRALFLVLSAFGLSACQSLQQNKVSVNYYQISGSTTAALDRQIKLKGPKVDGGRHAVAIARIRMIPNISYKRNANGCKITKARISVIAKVTLPRWTGHSTANKKLIKAWENIDRYTRLHESVHVAIAFRFAKNMENALLRLTTNKDCDNLKARAKFLVDGYLVRHDKVQKKFDADEQKRFAKFAKQVSKKS